MADWKAIYDRAEDMETERIRALIARRKAKQQAEQQASSQATTGTTTTLKEDKPQD